MELKNAFLMAVRFRLTLAVCAIGAVAPSLRASAVPKAAWTEDIISCEVGTALAGYNADDISVCKHDDLKLVACGVDDGENRVFLFVFDLIGIDAVNVQPMRARVAKALGVPAANVLFTCTHNHHGPHSRLFNGKEKEGQADVDRKYMAFLNGRIDAVAKRLGEAARWREVQIGFHSTRVDANRNRRLTTPDNCASFLPCVPELYRIADPIADQELGTVVFFEPGIRETPLFVIGNYAAHTLASHAPGVGGLCITADYPGFYRDYVKSATGADAMFIQGACGDLVPKEDELGMAAARALGETLAKASIRSVISIQRNDPRYIFKDPKVGGDLRSFGTRYRQKWVKKLKVPPERSLEVQSIAIGDVAFAGMPGEIVNEIGLEIKWHSPFKRTFIAYVSTGYDDYMCPANFIAAGGYEGRHQRFASRDMLKLINVTEAGLFDLRERLFPDSVKDGESYPDTVDLPLVALPGVSWDE